MIAFEEHELPNGLRVILHPDASVGSVTVSVAYRVGAADEQPPRTGLAHLFEHLMFSGSRNAPDYDHYIQQTGGSNNAFTTNDVTNYYLTVPAHALDVALWLEADRMQGLVLTEEKLAVQRSVVIEEFKQRYLNRPYGDAFLKLQPLCFTAHPYRWMTIGQDPDQIAQVTLEEAQDFYQRFYAPNNATLVLAGAFKPTEALARVQHWYGHLASATVHRPERPAEPTQLMARTTETRGPVPHTAVYKAYHAPGRLHPDYYAADLATDVLAASHASRLYRTLVKERRLATQVSAFSWGLQDIGMISVVAMLAEGVTAEQFDKGYQEVVDGLQDLAAPELDRYKRRVRSIEAFEKTDMGARAQSLAVADALGDAHRVNTDLDHYQAVTVGQVKQAAQQLLQPHRCSTLVYYPQSH